MKGGPILLALVLGCVAACTPSPSPQPSAPRTVPPSHGTAISCGPLDAESCQQAVTVAEATLSAPHPPLVAVRIETPSSVKTCPPSGGPPGAHICGVIVIMTGTSGDTTVGLVQSTNGWMWSNLIR